MIIDVLKNKVSLKAKRKMTRHREGIHGSMKLNTLRRKSQSTEQINVFTTMRRVC